jgi:hypothetical protein
MASGERLSTRMFVAFVAGLALTMAASAQQPEGEFDRALEMAMQRAAPDSRLESQPVAARGRSDVYKRWTSDGRRVSVRYFVRTSSESAAQLLQMRLSVLPIPTKKIDGFGDEAYLLAPSNPDGERTIWFRKGVVILEVAANGEDGARRFAALFGDAVSQARRTNVR